MKKKENRERDRYAEALSSPHDAAARRRIFKQLVESLLYEGIVEASETAGPDGLTVWTLAGRDAEGRPVAYRCTGRAHLTFGRLRLTDEPLQREGPRPSGSAERRPTAVSDAGAAAAQAADESAAELAEEAWPAAEEARSIALFLLEITLSGTPDPAKRLSFIRELEQTLLNDTLARHWNAVRFRQGLPAAPSDEDWEQRLIDGHPYHPSYKSRIGFRVEDQLAYGPEFGESIRPIWLAVRRERLRLGFSASLAGSGGEDGWIADQSGAAVYAGFRRKLRQAGADERDYGIVPVHPWQWRSVISSALADEIRQGSVILLGETDDVYTAQQSIRTLANRSRPEAYSLKLSLSIVNTSTSRVIAPHTAQNAPLITDWLQGLASRDAYLRDELRLILLGEIAGAAYDNGHLPDEQRADGYGVLSCIWRESVQPRLQGGEASMPFNGLCCVDAAGRPFIDAWVRRHGTANWLEQLLNVSVLPIIHWLFAHGIAFESHAQNMLLIHEEGWPVRIALKDFHDGIRFKPELLAQPERCPAFADVPAYHRRVNRNSFLVADDPAEVRDFVHDAFFFINLGELALFMHKHYGLSETWFWTEVRAVIASYQRRFPEHRERYELLSPFAATIGVEQLTKRRMYADDELHMHQVPNPLAEASRESRAKTAVPTRT